MKIVIDIPKEIYDVLYVDYVFNPPIRNGKTLFSILHKCIANGTLLPKGHGRLIDADKTLATAWRNFYAHEDEWEQKDPNYLPIGRGYDQNGFECCQQTIVNAPTIIEADKRRSR